jgi:hypothetical protein
MPEPSKPKIVKIVKKSKKSIPRRAYGALDGAKPRIFRASTDVGALLDQKITETGQTQSSIIDEGLRRVFWNEARYGETLVRNHGGPIAYAHGFIFSRVVVGIEQAMQARFSDSALVAEQVSKALHALVSSMIPDVIIDADGPLKVQVEVKHAPRRDADAKASVDAADHAERYAADQEPWLRVLIAIDHNLRTGTELWWPLADVPPTEQQKYQPEVPLRPSIADLRAVWRWSANRVGVSLGL